MTQTLNNIKLSLKYLKIKYFWELYISSLLIPWNMLVHAATVNVAV